MNKFRVLACIGLFTFDSEVNKLFYIKKIYYYREYEVGESWIVGSRDLRGCLPYEPDDPDPGVIERGPTHNDDIACSGNA